MPPGARVANEALNIDVIRQQLATHTIGRLATYRAKGAAASLAAWRDLDLVTGRRVEVREGATAFAGRALAADAEGHLQVKDARKRLHTIVSGQVRLNPRAR